MNDSLSIAENVPMQTDEMMEKRVCPVCNAEYSAHLQPEFEAHVENHFAQQQEQSDLAVAAAMNEETTSGSQDHRECPFCQLYFSKDNQDIFEKHVYSHMGFYPPLSSNQ